MTTRDRIFKWPVIGSVARVAHRITLYEGLTLYELLEIYIVGLGRSAVNNRSKAIAFSFFMALFPFALFILNLIPFIPIDHFQEDFLRFVADSVPPNTYDAISGIINDILNHSYGSLLSSGFLLSIFLQANGVNAILTAFENALPNHAKRPFLPQYIVALGISFSLNILLIVTVCIILVFEVFVQQTRLQDVVSDRIPLLQLGRYAFLILMVLTVTSGLFKFGTKQLEKRPFISVGSVFTTILFGMTSYLFGIWVVRFSRYNELYGSIGTLLIVMFYIWINCTILLLGFELNNVIQEHKQKIRRSKQTADT